MKATAVTILLLLCVENGLFQHDSFPIILSEDVKLSLTMYPYNLIGNGDFRDWRILPYPSNIPNRYIPDWEFSSGQAEIGRGKIYSKFWGSQQMVAELATDRDVTYTKPIHVKPGNYYLEFDWAPREGVRLSSSKIELRWNGDLYKTLVAPYHSFFKQAIGFHSSGATNKLSFTGAGDKEDTLGATISNLRVCESINHFKDGFPNFGNMAAHNGFFWGSKFYQWDDSMVIIFDYQPLLDQDLKISNVTVSVYEEPLLKLTPTTYNMRREFIRVQLSSTRVYYNLEFRDPLGRNVSGEMVTNVQVHQQPKFEGEYEIEDFPGMVAPGK